MALRCREDFSSFFLAFASEWDILHQFGRRFLQEADQEGNEDAEEDQEPLEAYDDQVEAAEEILEGLGAHPITLDMYAAAEDDDQAWWVSICTLIPIVNLEWIFECNSRS